MRTATVKKNQSLFDMALEQYGNFDAWVEIVENNPELANNPYINGEFGEVDITVDFFIDGPLPAGSLYEVDTDSELMKHTVLRQLENEIITFDMD